MMKLRKSTLLRFKISDIQTLNQYVIDHFGESKISRDKATGTLLIQDDNYTHSITEHDKGSSLLSTNLNS